MFHKVAKFYRRLYGSGAPAIQTFVKFHLFSEICNKSLSNEAAKLILGVFSSCDDGTLLTTSLDKSPWDSTAIFIFFCHFSVPS